MFHIFGALRVGRSAGDRPRLQYTMARFVEEAFTGQLERLKREHNGGREFLITNRKIRTGRPPGT